RQEAIAAFRLAIALQPGLAEAHNNLGNALKDQGEFDEAIAAYQRAIALRPELPDPYNNLGTVYKEQGRVDDAVAWYRKAVEVKPDFLMAASSLVFVLLYHPAYDA